LEAIPIETPFGGDSGRDTFLAAILIKTPFGGDSDRDTFLEAIPIETPFKGDSSPVPLVRNRVIKNHLKSNERESTEID